MKRSIAFAVAWVAVVFVAVLAAVPVGAQPWPNKPIRVLVPHAPGGVTDVITRIVMQPLSESLGQPIIVENRPGASGLLGTEVAARGGPGRLHAADVRRHEHDLPVDGETACARSGRELRADHAARARLAPGRRASVGARVEPEGVDRLREAESRAAVLCLAGHRQPAAPRRRDDQARGRHRHDAHSVQGRRPGDRRRRWRAGEARRAGDGAGASAREGRQAEGARRHGCYPIVVASRGADGGGIGASGLLDDSMDGHRCAGGDVAGHRGAGVCRGGRGPAPTRRSSRRFRRSARTRRPARRPRNSSR